MQLAALPRVTLHQHELFECLRVAFSALRANKLRSLLTMLGVIIGVGSVIAMLSIVQGARQKVVSQFRGDGADIVFAVYQPKQGNRQTGGSFEGLTLRDVDAIRSRVGGITSIVPEADSSLKAFRGKNEYDVTGVGVTADYTDVSNLDMSEGRFIDDDDGADWSKVCVLGDKVWRHLFHREDPIGQTIVLQNGDYRVPVIVVGLLKHKDLSGFGDDPNSRIILPLQTAQKRLLGTMKLSSITARSVGEGPEAAADAIFATLKQLHPEHAQDFIVDTQEGLLSRIDSVLMIFQFVLGGVGGLSLLVGGIGIMNIMLVSVTERTREIGIRKAIGAKRRDILLQFVTESMTVSGVGGLIGCLFGAGVARLISTASHGQLNTFVPPWAVGLGLGFALGVGMFFGIYPAVRASRLDPIVALRYE